MHFRIQSIKRIISLRFTIQVSSVLFGNSCSLVRTFSHSENRFFSFYEKNKRHLIYVYKLLLLTSLSLHFRVKLVFFCGIAFEVTL